MNFTIEKTACITTEMTPGTCATCGIVHAMPSKYVSDRRSDHQTFYCPNGHSNYFPHKSEAEKLRDELAQQKSNAEFLEAQLQSSRETRDQMQRQLQSIRGVVTRIKNRVSKGVCPCCNRQFSQLYRHMQSQHPEFMAKKD